MLCTTTRSRGLASRWCAWTQKRRVTWEHETRARALGRREVRALALLELPDNRCLCVCACVCALAVFTLCYGARLRASFSLVRAPTTCMSTPVHFLPCTPMLG